MVAPGVGPTDASPLRPGVLLGGRYRLLARIGAGGMGEVWRAEHTSLGTPSAVKVMDTALGDDTQDRLQRFQQEARAAAQLRSPHIVQVLDHGVEGRFAFIVMELLEGEGLDQRLARKGRLTPSETARVIAGMARGLARAHAAGIVHRDLKPANVFLTREGGGEVVKLLDFGIAKLLGPRADLQVKTHQGNVVGTPSYMSPEQVRGGEVDARSDLWQMGVIAWECLTGQRPFDGPTLGDTFLRICSAPLPAASSIVPVPPGFDAWIARAVNRDVDGRFSSATEMAAALLLILDENGMSSAGLTAGRVAWSAEAGTPGGGARRRWIALGVAGLVAGCGIGFLLLGPSVTPVTTPASPTARAEDTRAPLPPAVPSPSASPVTTTTTTPSASASQPPAPSTPPDRPPPARPTAPLKLQPADPLGI